ncbi:MAG: polyprenyl synthetase family protein [Firmicutes bacterium]|nr:polyprenyl synthetase family protein [Bacillota bacterium]
MSWPKSPAYQDLPRRLAEKARLVNAALEELVPAEQTYPTVIHQAMRYSLFAGGKRLRPTLTMAAAEALGHPSDLVLPTACALELIHTYSLIHDDLPAMDNDDYRRGRLTCHKVYGEAIAILAGDALLTLAFDLIARNAEYPGVRAADVLQIIREISTGAGTQGMIGGQVVDIQSENQPPEIKTLEYMHRHKTGALIRAAVRAGAILARASSVQLVALTRYAEEFGLAFQITDDILDLTGDMAVLGKPVGSDVRNQKATYPALFGVDQSRQMAQDCISRALNSLTIFDERADFLRDLAIFILEREQ